MRVRSLLIRLALLLAGLCAGPAVACTVDARLDARLGTYSPAAIAAGAVPALRTRAGLNCQNTVLALLTNNRIRARFRTRNGFKLLQQNGTAAIPYTASADPNGTYAFSENGTIDYMQNNLLNALGLLGSSSADLPIFLKPTATAGVPEGTYTERVSINWDWYLCPSVSTLGACLLSSPDQGTGATVIDVTVVVARQAVTVSMTSTTTWDPVNGTAYPKALPGSRGRMAMLVSNPDLVPLDLGSLALTFPSPANAVLALDGDGAGPDPAIRFADGSSASTLRLSYTGPADPADDVDFSADGGKTWTYAPVAGDVASEGAITHVRLKPRGAMAKSSNFTLSLAYQAR
jgi:hypothetical protein